MPTFRLGDMVRIKSGAFAAFTGKIEGINQTRSLLKVKVNLYGLEQIAKIKFSEAEKLEFKGAASSREG
jgi:transcriptional antiterminator NusG